MVQAIFEIALCFRDRYVFMWQSMTVSSVFNILTLKQIFWKTKTSFKKLENSSFLLKTALSEANVKTNRMVNTKWTYQKEWSVASQ